jgi:hypothetical protein
MCEHCSDGSSCRASIVRYAAYSKLSERKVQYILRSLCKRGILTQLAKGNPAGRRPATYRINEEAMEDDPRWQFSIDSQGRRAAEYCTLQQSLPGIARPWDPKIPDPPTGAQRAPVQDVRQPGAQDLHTLVHGVRQSGAQRAPDSKAFDPRTTNSRTVDSKARGDSKPPLPPKQLSLLSDLAEAMLREIGQPASLSLVGMAASAIEAIRTYHKFATDRESCDWLKSCIVSATSSDGKIGHGNKPLKFWLEDGDYLKLGTPPPGSPQAAAVAREAEELGRWRELMRRAEAGDPTSADEYFSSARLALPVPPPAVCDACGGRRLVHQQPHLPGPRLIPCPKCGTEGVPGSRQQWRNA